MSDHGTLDVLVFQNVFTQISACVSECVRLLSDHSMFSLCFRMCQITLDVSECVRSLLMFSLCFRMWQTTLNVQLVFQCVTLDVQFVFQNVSDCSL